MSNSSEEFWSVNGTSLNQYCWSVATLGGTPRSVPTYRGTDIPLAYVPGQMYRKKFPDERVITLNMWVAGIDPATDNPAFDVRRQFNDNLRTLQRVFYTPATGQISLTRQWYYTSPINVGTPIGAPTMVSATAMAEIAGAMIPSMTGIGRADLTVDLLLTDPYFYGNAQTSSFSLNNPITVFNPGDDAAGYRSGSQIVLNGPLYYPRLTNSTASVWVQLNTIIMPGDSVTFDLCNFAANRMSDGANLVGSVANSGNRRWMLINPGSNVLTLTSGLSTDSGNGTITFSAPYV